MSAKIAAALGLMIKCLPFSSSAFAGTQFHTSCTRTIFTLPRQFSHFAKSPSNIRIIFNMQQQYCQQSDDVRPKMSGASKTARSVDGQLGQTVNGIGPEAAAVGLRTTEEDFLRKFFDLMMREGISKPLAGQCKVIDFKDPSELKKLFDFKIRDEAETQERLLELCKETFDYSVKVAHPQFYNQLFGGQDSYSLAGAWMSDCLNESQYTYEVAPVFTLMEQEVLAKLRDLCGFKSGDGIFCPGGSTANMCAINHARYKMNPNYKMEGNFNSKPLVIFASDQSHYSLLKGAAFMGIGTNNVIQVKTDKQGRLIPEALETAILESKERGAIPLIVVATSGTTVLGAYDPLDKMADICAKHQIWLHIDAAWGGGTLLSRKHRHYLAGIERADSVTWCPHKLMGITLQCSAFLLNGKAAKWTAGKEDLMNHCMSAKAQYLFQQDKFYDMSYDTGDKSLQCGRKVDAFKLWLAWKAKGTAGFEAEIDHKFAISRYFAGLLKEREGFELVLEPQCTNVSFWYFPKCLRGQERTPQFWQRVSKVAPIIKEGMARTGSMLIGYQPSDEKINFFRIIFANARVTQESVSFVLEEIDRLGYDVKV